MMDKKGKLFGKINIVDFLVILVVIAGILFVGIKFLGPKSELGVEGKGTKLTYTVLVENVQPDVYTNLQSYLPSTLMAAGELLNGTVVAVSAKPHEDSISVSITGNAVIVPVTRGLLDVIFTIETVVPNRTTSEVGTQEVRIGKGHIVKTKDFELAGGIISNCIWEPIV